MSPTYPMLCTGCEHWWYLEDCDTPCPNCFPGLTREALLQRIEELVEEEVAAYLERQCKNDSKRRQ